LLGAEAVGVCEIVDVRWMVATARLPPAARPTAPASRARASFEVLKNRTTDVSSIEGFS
jgi:hypothetical protein